MKECDNSKIHISCNFILSISPLIMLEHLITKAITSSVSRLDLDFSEFDIQRIIHRDIFL
jgi:hypothetical protein